eukprot:5328710-Prymnesium_polylepis.1
MRTKGVSATLPLRLLAAGAGALLRNPILRMPNACERASAADTKTASQWPPCVLPKCFDLRDALLALLGGVLDCLGLQRLSWRLLGRQRLFVRRRRLRLGGQRLLFHWQRLSLSQKFSRSSTVAA